MKEHFDKLVITRARAGSHNRCLNNRLQTKKMGEYAPSKMSMKGTNHWAVSKQLSDYLAPVKRFLQGKVGHKWDLVYKELREQITPGNAVSEHLLSHVDGIVIPAKDVSIVDNKPCMKPRWGQGRAIKSDELYVDPVDGIIKRGKALTRKQEARNAPKQAKDYYWAGKNVVWKLIDQVWYEIILGHVAEDTLIENRWVHVRDAAGVIIGTKLVPNKILPRDILGGNLGNTRGWAGAKSCQELYGSAELYGKSKRQLCSKELKRIKQRK